MNNCKYVLAWVGPCNQECNGDYCAKHKDIMCSCGKKAIGECEMASSMVCGRETCDNNFVCHYHQKEDSVVW